MLLMTGNTRSGGVGQGRTFFVRRASGRSAPGFPHERSLLVWDGKRRALTDDAVEGTSATDARPCVFNTFTHSNRRVYTEHPLNAHSSS